MRPVVLEVAKIYVHELGEKATFKDLIREGGDFAVDYFESVIFPVPPTHLAQLEVLADGVESMVTPCLRTFWP